jgi:DNA polymerase-1
VTSVLDPVEIRLVDSVASAAEFSRWLSQSREILAVDTETGGLHPTRDRLRLVQFGDMMTGWAIPWDRWSGVALEALNRYEGPMTGHQILAFDSRFLKVHGGYDLPFHRCDDGMLQAAVFDSGKPKGLKDLADRHVDPNASVGEKILKAAMDKQGWTWDTIPGDFAPWWMYGGLDPVLSAHLHHFMAPKITYAQEAYDLERGVARISAKMMLAGMRVDPDYIRAESGKLEDYSRAARAWLKSEHGVDSVQSADQIQRIMTSFGHPITELTDGGAPKSDKKTLGAFRHHPDQRIAHFIQTILGVRHAERLSNNYLGACLEAMDSDGRVRATINTLAARTSRQSVSDPPLQQLPTDDKVARGAFVPDEGNVLISVDLAQIEARLGAHFSNDKALIEVFRQADNGGVDFFCALASQIFRQPIEKKDRRRALTKNVTYGTLFSSGLAKMAETAGVPIEQMRPVREGFDATYHELKTYSRDLIRACEQMGEDPYITTPTGRRLKLDRDRIGTQALNTMLQGHAAEYMKRCEMNIDAAGLGDAMRMVVHDEVILEVPRADAEDALRTVTECMTDLTTYRVPITADGGIMVERWSKN